MYISASCLLLVPASLRETETRIVAARITPETAHANGNGEECCMYVHSVIAFSSIFFDWIDRAGIAFGCET